MMDLTSKFIDAMSQDVLWTVSDFFIVTKQLANSGFEVSFWENEENWATLLYEDKVIGYLWQKYPVLFILSEFSGKIQSTLKEYKYLCIVESNSLESEEFRLNYNEFKDILVFGMNYEKFSAVDLWFQTNSI